MSILIRGIEMPTGSGEIIIRIQSDGSIHDQRGHRFNAVPKAVPVPPHGDLIDSDALILRVNMHGTNKFGMLDEDIRKFIDDAPTIIPASEDVKTEEDSEPWLCLSCRHYPPSSTDGKPCTQCNPSEVWHSCYDPAEEGE